MKRAVILIVFITGLTPGAKPQEILTGLKANHFVRHEFLRLQSSDGRGNMVSGNEDPVSLPFFDDFTQQAIYPSGSRWADREAYINENFPFMPANRGVATLDAINSQGILHVNASTFPFIADSLTSRPIRLDSIFFPVARPVTRADSLYLSFFYQPQGNGNPPERWDSLCLVFYAKTGDSVFAGYYDSITVSLNTYLQEGDTIFPGDTIFSPSDLCSEGLYYIADRVYTITDQVSLPCDSVLVPETEWQRVWSSAGMTLEEFRETYGTYCRQVVIPVLDSARFYHKDFRFRFYNFASLASEYSPSWRSNCDQWNIDYVYLGTGRSYQDTLYRDVSFVDPAPSLLKKYQAMPYNQYLNDPTNELKDNLELSITNLDSAVYNTSYYYTVAEFNGSFQYLFPGGNCNLYPFYEEGLQDCISCEAHACPPVNFVFFTAPKDSAELLIKHYIIGDITPVDTIADTVSFRQKFFNYYAYDDGSPEEGYGLTPSGARLAYRFKLNVKDTLRAVQMYFNHTLNDANEQYFSLMVWRDNNGKPGEALYTETNVKVEFTNSLTGFYTYMLEEPVPVNGVFYIGWEQYTNENLNIGFDLNNNAQEQIFYNVLGEWYQTTYAGALLMRPLLGKPFKPSGMTEATVQGPALTLYPNPVRGNLIHFRAGEDGAEIFHSGDYIVQVFDLLGSKLFESGLQPSVTIPVTPPGVYLVRISDRDGRTTSTFKLVKKP
jgi:hypothetical protein